MTTPPSSDAQPPAGESDTDVPPPEVPVSKGRAERHCEPTDRRPPPPRRRWLPWLGWLGFLICLVLLARHYGAEREYYDTTGGVLERFHSGQPAAGDKVAIIHVSGVIMEGSGYVKQQIDRVRQDPAVRAVVVRVNSPGGTVTGSDFIYHHLRELSQQRKLPLVVSMGSMAASGGYYVSMAVGDRPQSIFAEPTTTTGSIGVIVPHYDLSGLLTRLDVKNDSITSHPRKQLLSMTRAMSDDGRQIIQAYVGESFARFKEIVKRGRPILRRGNPEGELRDPKSNRDLATGEIFTATQAQRYGLIDQIGFIEQAIDRAIELAQLDKSQVRVVQYERPASLWSMLGWARAEQPVAVRMDQDSLQAVWRQFLDWTVPRAYFLAQ